MISRAHQISALSLTALGLAPGASHLMQLPVKMGYTAEMYTAVTSTLYSWYGLVGGVIQVAAFVSVAVLAFRAWRLPGGGLAAASAAALLASLLLWGFVVGPVNAAWMGAANLSPEQFAVVHDGMRARWEYGHVAAFIAWFTGWFGLVATVTRRPGPAVGHGAA
jgi:hypothetical protein